MKKLLVLSFCLIATGLSAFFPSFSISNERRVRAAALLADSPQAFKAAMEKAAASAQNGTQSSIENVVVLLAMGVRAMLIPGGSGVPIATCLALPGFVDACVSLARTSKRMKNNRDYEAHSEALYRILQSDEFKQEWGVEDWEAVAATNKRAENVGQGIHIILSLAALGIFGAHLTSGQIVAKSAVMDYLLMSLGLFLSKSLVTRAVRMASSAPNMDAVYGDALERAMDLPQQPADSSSEEVDNSLPESVTATSGDVFVRGSSLEEADNSSEEVVEAREEAVADVLSDASGDDAVSDVIAVNDGADASSGRRATLELALHAGKLALHLMSKGGSKGSSDALTPWKP